MEEKKVVHSDLDVMIDTLQSKGYEVEMSHDGEFVVATITKDGKELVVRDADSMSSLRISVHIALTRAIFGSNKEYAHFILDLYIDLQEPNIVVPV